MSEYESSFMNIWVSQAHNQLPFVSPLRVSSLAPSLFIKDHLTKRHLADTILALSFGQQCRQVYFYNVSTKCLLGKWFLSRRCGTLSLTTWHLAKRIETVYTERERESMQRFTHASTAVCECYKTFILQNWQCGLRIGDMNFFYILFLFKELISFRNKFC